MSAATAAILTPERLGTVVNVPLAADAVIYQGTLVCLDSSGNAVPAADTAALRVIGVAQADADNTDGDAGDVTLNVKRGVFGFANSGDAAVDADDKGKLCVVEDDSTVAETSTNKIPAGRVVDVDDDYVWVDVAEGPARVPTVITALAALTSTNSTAGAAVPGALTSTNGVAGAASADLAALAAEAEKIGDDVRAVHAAALLAQAEAEKIGDDVRAVHATVTTIITALQAHGIIK